jgi:hypothetical protein
MDQSFANTGFERLRLDIGNKETYFNPLRLTRSRVSQLDLVALEL